MTEITREDSVVALYSSHDGAEAAIKDLQRAGVDMTRLSIIGKDFHVEERAIGFYTSGDRIKMWGGRGAFWGSLWGIMFGGAFLFIPILGPIVAMGPIVGALVGALEGAAVGGASGVLAAALTSLDFPDASVVKYEREVKAGQFLVVARGSAELVEQARRTLAATDAVQLDTHTAHAAAAE